MKTESPENREYLKTESPGKEFFSKLVPKFAVWENPYPKFWNFFLAKYLLFRKKYGVVLTTFPNS